MCMEEQVHFFQKLLGNGYSPRPFQLEPAKYLFQGIPTILSAPTGSGKTWAAIFPFLYAKKVGQIFADRLFYVLPQRTLVRSIYNEIQQRMNQLDVEMNLRVAMQMGDQSDDPLFEGDIILTTIDQVLSNYIGASFSVSKGMSNIPPGAFAGAYFVFDEIHAVPKESLPTISDLARRYRFFSRFLLMTATIPNTIIKEMKQRINGEDIVVIEKDLGMVESPPSQDLQTNTMAKRMLFWKEDLITVEEIFHHHFKQEGVRKSIVVVNRVERAQRLYQEIKHQLQEENQLEDQVYLLHSRFLSDDRKEIEQKVIDSLGKKSINRHTLVIATQVIEVGLDLSSNVLITELAPANAIIQRAGRCARFYGEQGEVYVYNLPLNKKGELDTAPYLQTDHMLVKNTRNYLIKEQSFPMTLNNEIQFVETVHQGIDLQKLENISPATIREKVSSNQAGGNFSGIRLMVRNIHNISIIIHDQPQRLDMTLVPERFSIHTSTIKKLVSENTQRDMIWGYQVIESEEGVEESSWVEISNPTEVDHFSIIAIHTSLASYSKDVGLRLTPIQENVREMEPVYQAKYTLGQPKGLHPQYHYQKETYVEHVAEVRYLFQKQKLSIQSALTYFAQYYHVDKETLAQVVEMAIAFHDAGKLNEEIAKKYWNWQKSRRNEEVVDYLAHTDYDPTNEDDFVEWKKQKRIPHAIEGAYISYPMVEKKIGEMDNDEQAKDELKKGVFTAIARHHHSYAKNFKTDGKLTIPAQKTLARSLSKLSLSFDGNHMSWSKSINLNHYWTKPFDESAWIWYWFVVRNIRLVDHQSQKNIQTNEVKK